MNEPFDTRPLVEDIPVLVFNPDEDETSEQFEERIVSLIEARMRETA